MGVPCISQVRFLHLAIVILAAISLLIYVAYLITPQQHMAPTPISFETRSQQQSANNNATQQENFAQKNESASPGKAANVSSDPSIQLQSSQPDLSKGIPAKVIYESGHFDLLSNENVCEEQGKNIGLLIAVTSAPSHEAARMAIRHTWGHYTIRRDVSIAFMLGSTPNKTLNEQIEKEQFMYQDIIRGKFVDAYDNLTLKTISMLEWVDHYCPKADFVLKTDDDMFINVPKLLAFISKHTPDQRAIYGRLAKKWKPIRNKKSKYFISIRQYRPSIFPDFTTGPAYLFPAKLSKELYSAALTHPYFKLEDVFITGIVADSLKIKRILVPEFLNKRVSLTPCNIQKGISVHMVKGSEQYDLWKKLLDGLTKCK